LVSEAETQRLQASASRRVIRQRLRKRGRFTGGQPPYGFLVVGRGSEAMLRRNLAQRRIGQMLVHLIDVDGLLRPQASQRLACTLRRYPELLTCEPRWPKRHHPKMFHGSGFYRYYDGEKALQAEARTIGPKRG
jgi:hypothetical protein